MVKSEVTEYACEVATELNLKSDEISEEKALSVILDDSLDPIVRVTMIQLLEKSDKSLQNDTALKELLFNEKTDYAMRQNIMWLLAKNDSNIGIIKSFAEGRSGKLAFQAFKILSIYAPDEVVPLADKVITNYKNEDTDKVRGAVKFKAIQIGRDKLTSESEVNDFIRTCLDLRDTYSDSKFNETVTFALSDMKNAASIKILLNDAKIKKENKAFCIRENEDILLDMAKNASQKEVDLLSTAMSIYPLAEVAEVAELTVNSVANSAVITATGNQGYAVYRNGAGMNVDEHAGLVIASSTVNPCVIEMASTQQMRKSSWSQFLNAKTYYGVYRPSGGISSAGRDAAIGAANALYDADPGYVLAAQLGYPASLFGNARLYAYQVVNTRCDGVVEFAFEYNDYKVYGSTYWNITIPSSNSITAHTISAPSLQRAAMTRVTTATP